MEWVLVILVIQFAPSGPKYNSSAIQVVDQFATEALCREAEKTFKDKSSSLPGTHAICIRRK